MGLGFLDRYDRGDRCDRYDRMDRFMAADNGCFFLLPGAELFREGVLDLEAVAAFGCEVDVFWPGEDLFFFVFAEDAAGVLGDDLDALEGGAVAAGVGADEADVGPEGAAGAALVAVEDEPHGPLPGVVIEADFFDVTLGKGACGFVAGG